MDNYKRLSLLLLRLSLGWMFFYAGFTKVIDPSWSSAGYLKAAKTFPAFYNWLLSPQIIPIVDFLNEWGLTLLGVALVIGLFVRLSSILSALLMLLYYLPILNFPYPNPHALIVDEHIIYICAFIILYSFDAGRILGLDHFRTKRNF